MLIDELVHVRICFFFFFFKFKIDLRFLFFVAPNEYLLVAMEKEIRSISMQPHGSLTSAPWRAITNLSLVVGIDFDYRDKKIFYTYVK